MSPEMMKLLGLFLVPVSVFIVARRRYRRILYTLTGLSLGLVISPASVGMYGLYFVSPLGVVPGILGLALSLIHGAPGYQIATFIGAVDTHSPLEGNGISILYAFDGLVWGGLYGALGYAIDRYRKHNRVCPSSSKIILKRN